MKTNLERIKQDLEELTKFTATPGEGMTRLSLTEEDQKTRGYLTREMRSLGIQVYEDAAGNLFGRIEGELKDGPVVMVGSHFDSVRNGGNFDGPAGVVAGLEIARVIMENNIKTRYPVEVVAMIEEEGGRFGQGLYGSKAMAGKVTKEQLMQNRDENGISMFEAMKDFGLNPERIETARRDKNKIKAFLELHIEQGPVLEKNGEEVGIVHYIVGIHEFRVKLKGRPDHAGTTPMDMRADPLDAASKVISRISGLAREAGQGTVVTVGILNVKPGAANIVPSEVVFTVDIRSKDSSCIDWVGRQIQMSLETVTAGTKVRYEMEDLLKVEPVELSQGIRDIMGKYCEKKVLPGGKC